MTLIETCKNPGYRNPRSVTGANSFGALRKNIQTELHSILQNPKEIGVT